MNKYVVLVENKIEIVVESERDVREIDSLQYMTVPNSRYHRGDRQEV